MVEAKMKTIVILENNQNELQKDVHIANAKELGARVVLLSQAQRPTEPGVELIHVTNGELNRSLDEAAKITEGETVIVLDAALKISKEDLSKALEACSGTHAKLFSLVDETGQSYCSHDFTSEQLPAQIGYQHFLPMGIVSVPAVAMSNLDETTSAAEAICKVLINAISEAGPVETQTAEIQIDKENAEATVSMNNAARASALRFLIHSINIEELFPNHSWEKHQEECAAACYHTLAATFIKLEDYNSAIECLALSDRLEDSPRSLALKGLIALQKGETLTAVANMVSSLQEYERRKKETEGHYLSFIPKDLEKINTNLQSGLSALNKRENDTAANCFREAVFHFDSFYEDCGLQSVKQ